MQSLLARFIEHVAKMDAHPGSDAMAHRWSQASHVLASARRTFSPSMRRLIDVETIWSDGVEAARKSLTEDAAKRMSLTTCPFELDEFLAADFDLDAALARLAGSGSSQRGEA